MKFILAALALFLATSANAQSVQQSGYVTPGHAVEWVTNGVVKDAGAPNGSGTGGTQYGTTCSNLSPYSFFANTSAAPTGTTLGIYDTSQCVYWAILNQSAHDIQLTPNSVNASAISDPNSISCVLPSYGGTWVCQNQFSSTSTTSHSDGRATLYISRNAVGSGTFGPADQDAAVFIGNQKTNYLTSTVEGEMDGINCVVEQGVKGDTSCLLLQTQKVFASSGETGGFVVSQHTGNWINSSGQALMTLSNISGFGEGAGGLSNHTGYGSYTESQGAANAVASSQIQPYAGYYVGAYDANSNCTAYCPTFTNAFVASGSRASNGNDVFFAIAMGVNQSGKVTLGSGNADGQDGNPTLSGGTRLSFANVSGVLKWYAANGTTVTAALDQTGGLTLTNFLTADGVIESAANFGNLAMVQTSSTNSGHGYRWILNGPSDDALYLQYSQNSFTSGPFIAQITGNLTAASAILDFYGAVISGVSVTSPTFTATSAAPTVSASQVGYGGTVEAAGSGTCPSGTVGGQTVAGCLIINVAGTTHYAPYF